MVLEKTYKPSAVFESDFLIPILQTCSDKQGFLEMDVNNSGPVYRIRNGRIEAVAFTGISKQHADLLFAYIKEEELVESIASIAKKKNLKIAFYNHNQPIDKSLKFFQLDNPISLDNHFFISLEKYLSPPKEKEKSEEDKISKGLDSIFR